MIDTSPYSRYRKGVKKVALFYIIGTVMTLIFHVIVGWENAYAPPISVVALMFLFIVGMLWAALDLTCLLDARSRPQSLGELTIHAIVLSVSTSLILVRAGVI
jgi:hypothetical protein